MARWATVLSLVLVCFFSGCAKYYYQEGKTLEECRQDAKGCYADFKKYQDRDDRDEVGRYNVVYDYEGTFMDSCMDDKGYGIVSESKLPLKVKREDTDRWSRVHRGLSGTLD